MEYQFSFGAFFFGVLITGCGALMTLYHRQISDNLASGVSSYDRVKFWALIICVVGLTVAANLHALILTWIFSSIFPSNIK